MHQFGAKSVRFTPLPPIDQQKIGPGTYEVSSMLEEVEKKTHSNLGVHITTVNRFIAKLGDNPSACEYNVPSFIEDLERKKTSHREFLNSMDQKKVQVNNNFPGPGSNEINYAIGRHVANDTQFALLKSSRLMTREKVNLGMTRSLTEMSRREDLFTDKRACRRMQHFALYFP